MYTHTPTHNLCICVCVCVVSQYHNDAILLILQYIEFQSKGCSELLQDTPVVPLSSKSFFLWVGTSTMMVNLSPFLCHGLENGGEGGNIIVQNGKRPMFSRIYNNAAPQERNHILKVLHAVILF